MMHNLLFIGMEYWDGVWRRSQNLVAGLARRFPEQKILFVELPNNLSYAVRKRQWGEFWRGLRPYFPQPLPELPNVFVFRPTKVFPNTLLLGRLANEAIYRTQVRRAARRLGMERPLLWIKPHYGAHLAGKMGECAVVYDVGDDWATISQPEAVRRRTLAEDAYLTCRADAVIVVSDYLLQQKRPLREKVSLIPNGVEVERYLPISERTLTPHPLTCDWKSPVLGYTGMLHPDRLDIPLLIEVARAFPKGNVVLVGPSFLSLGDTKRLCSEPNILLTGPVEHLDLPRVMSAFDVCLVPNLVNAFSESQNPLKLYEYLASGLPTVSTPISGFRNYPELVSLASDATTFVQAIRNALTEPKEKQERRQQEARKHTWDARVEAVLRVFAELPV